MKYCHIFIALPILFVGFHPTGRVQDGTTSGVMTAGAALNRASIFARKANIIFDQTRARTLHEQGAEGTNFWIVTSPQIFLTMDDEGKLRTFSNKQRENYLRHHPSQPRTPYFSSDEQIWRSGEAFASVVGMSRSDLKRKVLKKETPGKVQVLFAPKPFGYEVIDPECGIILDSQDGEVLEAWTSSGWTYDRPGHLISKSEAVRRARQIIGEQSKSLQPSLRSALYDVFPSAMDMERRSKLVFVTSNGGWGSARGEAIRRQRHIRLCYILSGQSFTILVDATSGDCLGGGLARSLQH
jgi:hypothetical protein